jgi:hypothetical protein
MPAPEFEEHGPQNLGLVVAVRPTLVQFFRDLLYLGCGRRGQTEGVQALQQTGDVLVLDGWRRAGSSHAA